MSGQWIVQISFADFMMGTDCCLLAYNIFSESNSSFNVETSTPGLHYKKYIFLTFQYRYLPYNDKIYEA
jgi:hypothetical protein